MPRAYWYSDDSEALGAPFFICEFVKGDAPVPWTADGGPAFDETARINLGDQFVTALAALHNFAWRSTPVAGIGGATDPDETAASQIAFWEERMRQWSTRTMPSWDRVGHVGFVLTFYFASRTLPAPGDIPSLGAHFLLVPVGIAITAGFPARAAWAAVRRPMAFFTGYSAPDKPSESWAPSCGE